MNANESNPPVDEPSSAKQFLGSVSTGLFIFQLVVIAFLSLAGYGSSGGHPSGGAMAEMLIFFAVAWLSPLGVLLGALGSPGASIKSRIGLAGNLLIFIGLCCYAPNFSGFAIDVWEKTIS